MQATIKIFLLKSLGDKELVNFDFPQYKSKNTLLSFVGNNLLGFFPTLFSKIKLKR